MNSGLIFRSWGLAVPLLLAAVAWSDVSRPQITVPYVNTAVAPITIDGLDDDWGAGALAHGVRFYKGDGHAGSAAAYGTTVLGTMSNRADGEVLLFLAHDGSYLYVLALVYDDLLEQRSGEQNSNEAWREDALQLYFDTTNAHRADIPNPPITNQVGYEQFSVSTDYNCYTVNCDFTTNNTAGAAGPGAEPDQVHWLVAVDIAGSGPFTYTFEERIPLTEVLGRNLRTMEPGMSYRFDAEFVDSDAGTYLEGWMFWSSDGVKDPWNSQDRWGTMTLEALPVHNGQASVAPLFIIYPEQSVDAGPTAPQRIDLENSGTGSLGIAAVTKTGDGAAHFVITGDTGQTALEPGQVRQVSVVFDPWSVGDKVGYVNFSTDDPAHPTMSTYLWGKAVQGPDIDVDPASWSWLLQSIPDGPGPPKTVSIGNVGGGSLCLSSVALAGAAPGQFTVVSDTGQTTLGADQVRAVTVAFAPTTPGTSAAVLRIASNDPDEPTVDITLSGTAFDPVAGYMTPVWVESGYNGLELGTEAQPCNTLGEAVALVLRSGTIKLKPGNLIEVPRISKPMRVEAPGLTVRIGTAGP